MRYVSPPWRHIFSEVAKEALIYQTKFRMLEYDVLEVLSVKKLIGFLLSVILFCTILPMALAIDVEITGPDVNLRKEPKGKVITRFEGGEVLPALDEIWSHDQLWYQVHSDRYGDGYVSGEWARPVWNGITIYDPDHPEKLKYVTENVESFYTDLYRFLYDNGYCYWNQEEGGTTFRVSNGIGDGSVVQPGHKLDLALMLLKNGLLVENRDTAILMNETSTEEEKMQSASSLLRRHYGTEDMWEILIQRGVMDHAEAHVPHGILENDDVWKLAAILDRVSREYAGSDGDSELPSDSGNERWYINPNGGTKLHSDPYCRSVHEKYLPLQEIELTDEILQQYSRCAVCSSGSQQPSAEEAAVEPELVLPEKELNSITAQWESIYGNYLLWNYKTNADFVKENGTQPDVPYIFNRSLLNCYPDEDAIPAEEIEKMAMPLIVSYGSDLNEEKLSSCRIIVNAYKKPDMDGTLFSQSGSWIVGVWDRSKAENIAYIYIDSHTGIPSYFRLTQEQISYIGEPGVEPVKDND